MSLTTVASLPSAATHTVGKLMVLAPRTSTLPKLLLKPGRWTVGSAATCSYQVAAEGVRPRHVLLLCGSQTTVLKAWDTHTWHNDQRVNGEVRLQLGDRLKIGSVEFSIESPGNFDVVGQLPDVPPATSRLANLPTDVTDLERLRAQIHELRDDLSRRMARRKEATPIESDAEARSQPDADTNNARLTESEQTTAETRSDAEQTQPALAEARLEHQRREAELQQVANQLRATLETAQNEVAELHRERDDLRSEAERREQAWQQQLAEWSAEREQWQDELLSLANARQQLAMESEQRQATLTDDAKRWQTECEQLRAESLQRQPAWDDERAQMQDELRQLHEASQHASRLAAQREQELAEQSQQLFADHQQWGTERDELRALHEQLRAECDQLRAEHEQHQTEIAQFRTRHEQLQAVHDQLQAESEGYRTGYNQHEAEGLEREQAVAALNDERQRVEQQAAEVAANREELSRRLAEFELHQSELTREKLTLEHSWTWLQSDRRKLAEEKDQWQQQRAQSQAERESWLSDREKLAVERSEFNAEQTAWSSQREQFDSECRTKSDEFAAIRAGFDAQQQVLRDEQTRLAEQSADLETRTEALARDRESVLADRRAMLNDSPSQVSEQVSPSDVLGAATDRVIDRDWTSDATSMPRTWETESSSTDATLVEPWNIGVDLTAPRETLAADWSNTLKSQTEPADSISSEPSGGAWGLATSPPIPTSHDADTQLEQTVDPAVATLREMLASADLAVPPSDKSEANASSEAKLPSANNETTIDPTPGPVVSILESLAFSDDEDIDDSVSRYMQHLLARSQNPGEAKLDRYVPAHSIRSTAATNASRELTPSQVSLSDPSPAEESNSKPPETAEDRRIALEELETIRATLTPMNPTHVQNKDVVRAVTQQMRQVANQQTVTNVEAANWKQLKGSIKNKMALATLAFLISGGLLYWGYQDQPKFLVLGVCTSGLGLMTLFDLIIDIGKARARTSRLAGRTKKPS